MNNSSPCHWGDVVVPPPRSLKARKDNMLYTCPENPGPQPEGEQPQTPICFSRKPPASCLSSPSLKDLQELIDFFFSNVETALSRA